MLRTLPRALRPGLVPLLLVFLLPCASLRAQEAGKTGVAWRDLTLDQALQEAASKDQIVMVDVWAAHCHTCGTMTEEVWDTPQGAQLADGLIPIQVNSVTDAGHAFAARYPVTGLPAVIFLRADGTEIDRVEGYDGARPFFYQTSQMKAGVDALPAMEAILKDHPDSLNLMMNVMEKYMFRKRTADVDTLYNRILRLDRNNQKGMAERAIVKMGRYTDLVLHDDNASIRNWQMMADRFPGCLSIGGALDGVWTAYMHQGRSQEWLTWACDLLDKNKSVLQLQRQAVAIGLRGGYRSPCLAEAARRSRNSFPGREVWYDSIAVVMEGGTWPPPGYVRPAAGQKNPGEKK